MKKGDAGSSPAREFAQARMSIFVKKRHFFKNSLEKVYSNAQKWVEKVHSGVLGGGAS
jgi:hypothetical protein